MIPSAHADKPQDAKPEDAKPKEGKPEKVKPADDKPKDEAKPQIDNTDIHVGVGWDIKQNKADLSTWVDNGLQWFYQWSLQPTVKDVKAEFIPMFWGPADPPKAQEAMAQWPENTKHVFSFNEREFHFLNGA